MRRLKVIGLCLGAMLAIAAIGASSASALPEWGQCYAKAGGKYTESNCLTKSKLVKGVSNGAYEWRKNTEVSNKHFQGENVGSGGVLTTEYDYCVNGKDESKRVPRATCIAQGGTVGSEETHYVECESERNTGETAGTKEVKNVAVIFKGCKLFGAAPCSNGSEEGEIAVNPLKGTLGYINKSKKEVGVLLTPVKAKGEFAKFSCVGLISIAVGVGSSKEGAAYSPETTGGRDGIISPITPINQTTPAFTQTYTINSNLENVPSHFEGKPDELLEDYAYPTSEPGNSTFWNKAGETVTNVNHMDSGEEAEIKG